MYISNLNAEGCSSGLRLLSTGGGAGFHMGGNAGRFFLRCAPLALRRGRMAGSYLWMGGQAGEAWTHKKSGLQLVDGR